MSDDSTKIFLTQMRGMGEVATGKIKRLTRQRDEARALVRRVSDFVERRNGDGIVDPLMSFSDPDLQEDISKSVAAWDRTDADVNGGKRE